MAGVELISRWWKSGAVHGTAEGPVILVRAQTVESFDPDLYGQTH